MKLRVLDRILVAIAGLLILAVCAGIMAQVFFNIDMVDKIAKVLTTNAGWARAVIAVVCVLLLLIGCYCVLVLFRHRRRKDRFIMQKMESGDLAISLKAMETMVTRCLEQRKEIEPQSVRLENQRDGLVIVIRGTVASGISIPLTVDTLQKQIKQYVTACSGVEVKGIRVQIESSGEEAKNAPFSIDAPAPTPLLQSAETAKEEHAAAETETSAETAPEPENIPVAVPPVPSAAESAIEAVENLKKEHEEEFEDDRPIHQRLFSTPEEPCIMPLPPEDLTVESPAAEDIPAEEEIPATEAIPAAEEIPAEEESPADDETDHTAPDADSEDTEPAETVETEEQEESGTEDEWK